MAKSKSFFGLRKGSTKTMTFSILKGQQITKDRVTDVANPKTRSQMVQRMIFSQTVKFYKQALQNFFRFAFEDKKATESDYNAFVRHNVSRAIAVDYDNYKNQAYPSIGNFMVTQGSLPRPETEWTEADNGFSIYADVNAMMSTIGQISQGLLSYYPGLAVGDIVTIVRVVTNLDDDAELVSDVEAPWEVKQFIIDLNDNRTADTVLWDSISIDNGAVYLFDKEDNRLQLAAVTFSRNTPNGLKVSDAYMIPSQGTWYFIESLETAAAKAQCARSWGATDEAILQGGLVDGTTEVTYKATISGGRYVENGGSSEKVVPVSWSPSIPPLKAGDVITINGQTIATKDGARWYYQPLGLGLAKSSNTLNLIVGANRPRVYIRTLEINGQFVELS